MEQVKAILLIQESYLTELKSKEVSPSKLSETVSAFANAIGGDIYIGINENKSSGTRHWDGFSDLEAANALPHVLFQAHPFGNHLKFEFLEAEGMPGSVLHITVKKVKEIIKSSGGDIYVRVNAGKQKIDTPEKVKRLELDKGVITFENEWVEVPIERIENSVSIISFVLNIIPTAETITYLNNQDLIKVGHAKVAGVLLFCDEPAVFIPKRCSIKLMRYRTKDEDIGREFLDGNPITVEGDIYNLIYTAVAQTKKMVEKIQRL